MVRRPCSAFGYEHPEEMKTGSTVKWEPWVCPVCGRGMAPGTSMCDHGGTPNKPPYSPPVDPFKPYYPPMIPNDYPFDPYFPEIWNIYNDGHYVYLVR